MAIAIIPAILLLLILPACSQNCSPSPANDQLQTGTFTLLLTANRAQCFNATLDSAFSGSQPQVAVGINSIANYQSDPAGLDYSLRALLPTPTQLSIVLFVNNNTWVSLSITYLVSARAEIALGLSSSNGNSLSACNTTSQNYPIVFPLPASQPLPTNSSSLGVLILLSGIRTNAAAFALQFTQPLLDNKLIQINTSAITNASQPIQLIEIYYLIVDLNLLASNGYNYTFSLTPSPGNYLLAGVVALGAQAPQMAYFGLNRTNNLTCLGFNCSGCQSAASCLALSATPNATNCIKCPSTQVYTAAGCLCPNGLNLINNICAACPPGTVYNATTAACQLICPANSVPSPNGCVCSLGYYNISGSCQQCPQGTVYNALFSVCSSLCATNQVWNNGGCQCVSGYTPVNGQCQMVTAAASAPTCPANMYVVNGGCSICPANLLIYQNSCFPCPANSSVINNQTACQCNSGYKLTPAYTCQPQTTAATQPPTPQPQSQPPNSPPANNPSNPSGSPLSISNIYGGTSNIANSATGSTSAASCPTRTYYRNGACRNSANITVPQSVIVQNTVYLSIEAANLPEAITSNGCPSCPSLINAAVLGNPAGITTTINYVPYERNMWIVAMTYSTTFFTSTLLLSFSANYTSSFTPNQMQYVLQTLIDPTKIRVYKLIVSSPSLITNDVYQIRDILGQTQPQQKRTVNIPSAVLKEFGIA